MNKLGYILRSDYELNLKLEEALSEIDLLPRVYFFDEHWDFVTEEESPKWFMITDEVMVCELCRIVKNRGLVFDISKHTGNIFFDYEESKMYLELFDTPELERQDYSIYLTAP